MTFDETLKSDYEALLFAKARAHDENMENQRQELESNAKAAIAVLNERLVDELRVLRTSHEADEDAVRQEYQNVVSAQQRSLYELRGMIADAQSKTGDQTLRSLNMDLHDVRRQLEDLNLESERLRRENKALELRVREIHVPEQASELELQKQSLAELIATRDALVHQGEILAEEMMARGQFATAARRQDADTLRSIQ